MRISFFGHADFNGSEELEYRLISIIKGYTDVQDCEFLFGGYGRFDDFAFNCVSKITSPFAIQKTFVTPYITESYQRNQLEHKKLKYDMIIYPEIEKVPYRFAISERNKWIVEQSDIVISYVNHRYGGAYSIYSYAKRRKPTFNLGTL